MIFVPYNQASEILKPGKEPFNLPSSLIWSQLSAILCFFLFSTPPVRCNHFYTAFIHQLFIKGIAVICLISNQLFRCIRSKAVVNGLLNQLHFMGRSAFHTSGDRKTRSVCDCHDLGAFATFCLANSKTPFFAGAKLPSMNASLTSIFPRS